jgi:Ras family protein T1
VEISDAGYKFLSDIFAKYDADKDQALSPQELVNLFCTCPVMPWSPADVSNTASPDPSGRGYLTLAGYLGLWTLHTLLDSQKTLEYLACLGYNYYEGDENQLSALQVTRWGDYNYTTDALQSPTCLCRTICEYGTCYAFV